MTITPPRPDASAATRLHVERTDDPAVLRWVVHDPTLADAGDGSCRPTPGTALGALVLSGEVREVCVRDGHVLVRVADVGRWSAVAPRVHQAIAADVALGVDWLAHRDAERPSWSLQLSDDPARPIALRTCCPDAGAACGHCAHG